MLKSLILLFQIIFTILFKMSLHMLSITPASDTTQACAYLAHFCEYFVKQALKRSVSVIGLADTAFCDRLSVIGLKNPDPG